MRAPMPGHPVPSCLAAALCCPREAGTSPDLRPQQSPALPKPGLLREAGLLGETSESLAGFQVAKGRLLATHAVPRRLPLLSSNGRGRATRLRQVSDIFFFLEMETLLPATWQQS